MDEPAVKRSYSQQRAARVLHVPGWAFDALVRHGFLAGAGNNERWPAEQVHGLRDQLSEALNVIGDQRPLGANKAAALLAHQLGLQVTKDDVDELANRDWLPQAWSARGEPLTSNRYRLFDVVQVAAVGDQFSDLIARIVAERCYWHQHSKPLPTVMTRLGLDRSELERHLTHGEFHRYTIAEVEALATGKNPQAAGGPERQLSADEAATRLRVRRVDFDHCTAAGWVTPCSQTAVAIGEKVNHEIPLYRAGDVDQILARSDVDWEKVRRIGTPWDPSPLRAFADRPGVREPQVRGLAADLEQQYSVSVHAELNDRFQWLLRWWNGGQGGLTEQIVRAHIDNDPKLRTLSDRIVLDGD